MQQKAHRKNLFLKLAGGLLAGALLLIFGAIFLISSDYGQERVSGALRKKIGHDISIEGPLEIVWGWPRPRIHAEKVRIANMPGTKEPYLLDVEKIDFTLNLRKLLIGKLEIPEMLMLRPQVFLEKKDAKTKNWDLPALSGAEAVLPDRRGEVPVIGTLRVTEGKVVYKDIPRDLHMTLNIDTIKGKGKTSADTFALTGDGTIEGKKFQLKAEGGSLELLRDTRREFPLAFEITVGEIKFALDGTFTDPIRLKGLNAALNLSGGNLADLFYLLQIPFPPSPPFKLTGGLGKEGKRWTFDKFSGSVGHSDLSGNVVYSRAGERPLLSGDLFSKRLDVADLGGLIGFSPAGPKRRADGSVLPDVPINLKRLRAGDMDLNLKAAKLNAPGWPLSDMQTHISLKAGLLRLDPLKFGAADGVVEGFLEMDGRKETPQVKMDLDLKRLSLGRFFTASGFEEFSKGTFGGQIKLQGPGSSLARVLGNSDGRIVFIMTGGRISLRLIEAADLDIAELIPLTLGRDQTTDIRCGIGNFNVQNGLLTSRVFVLDTTDTNLEGDVIVNLKTETMEASLNAHPKDPSLLSLQTKILLSGKMSKPAIMIDPLSVGARGIGAVVLGAIAPLAAILPFISLGGGEDADCQNLIYQAQKSAQKF